MSYHLGSHNEAVARDASVLNPAAEVLLAPALRVCTLRHRIPAHPVRKIERTSHSEPKLHEDGD